MYIDPLQRTPAEVPTAVPTLTIVERLPMGLNCEMTEQTTEGANRVALPKYYKVA